MLSAPKAPDPYATAAAQGAMNKDTAIATQELNMIGQKTPDGSLTYSQTGTSPSGTPQYTATQTLSPGNQALYDSNQKTQQNLGNIATQQSAQLGQMLATPIDTSQGAINGQTAGMPALPGYRAGASTASQDPGIMGGLASLGAKAAAPTVAAPAVANTQATTTTAPDAVAARYTQAPGQVASRITADPTKVATRSIDSNDQLTSDLYSAAMSRYQPQLDRSKAQMETDLANRGLKPGSDAYSMAQQDYGRNTNDLMASTFLQGQNQAFQQSATRAQNDFSQDLSANNQFQTQSLATNAQNFGQDLAGSKQAFDQNLAANAQNYGMDQTSTQNKFNNTLAANGQNFTQQLQANNQNYGMAFQNAGFDAQQQQADFDRANGYLSAASGIQGQNNAQVMANAQLGVAQDQFNYGAGMGQRTQALSEIMQNRQEPINEIAALLGGSQVSKPQYTATPQANIQPADLTGLVQSNYAAKTSQYNGLLGGLAGLGGSLGSAAIKFSDERLKEDVQQVGVDPDTDLPIYKYRYKPETGLGGGLMQLGVMAQDVEKKNPGAVIKHPSGFKMVDYSQALAA